MLNQLKKMAAKVIQYSSCQNFWLNKFCDNIFHRRKIKQLFQQYACLISNS
jgi:hypothetical protein